MTQHFFGTKIISAAPMTRAEYNDYRGWAQPDNENGADEGYLVEYLDGGKGNDSRHKGYISWSPQGVFEAAYLPLGHIGHLPAHVQRMVAELAELDDRHGKLAAFLKTSAFLGLSEADRNDLSQQFLHMADYGNVLRKRVDRATEAAEA